MRFFRFFWCVLMVIMFRFSGQAQSPTASFEGRVFDPSNGAVVGAQITATPERRTSSLSTVSDQTGKFSLELEPGKYIIRITAMGFLEASEAIEISNLSQTRDFLLRLPVVRQTIDNRATAQTRIAS